MSKKLMTATFVGAITLQLLDAPDNPTISATFKIIDRVELPSAVHRDNDTVVTYNSYYMVAILNCEVDRYNNTVQRIHCNELVNCTIEW